NDGQGRFVQSFPLSPSPTGGRVGMGANEAAYPPAAPSSEPPAHQPPTGLSPSAGDPAHLCDNPDPFPSLIRRGLPGTAGLRRPPSDAVAGLRRPDRRHHPERDLRAAAPVQ